MTAISERMQAAIRIVEKRGYLHTPCKACGMCFVVPASGKWCLNCGAGA